MRLPHSALALCCLLACHSVRAQSVPAQETLRADQALRLRVAQAELRRADGASELMQLSAGGPIPQRVLALRGLGRTGLASGDAQSRSPALQTVLAALSDPATEVVAAAASALALGAALEEVVLGVDAELTAAWQAGKALPEVLEAMASAGSAALQPLLVEALARPQLAEAAAVSLGRHGRRRIAFDAAARTALAAQTRAEDTALRYAAVYALSREFEPPEDAGVVAALSGRLSDREPEVRAQAVVALGKRKAIDAARQHGVDPGQLLRDPDFRVAVQAIRAHADSEAGRDAIAAAISARFRELAADAALAHVQMEGLRALFPDAARPSARDAFGALARAALANPRLPALTRGHILCLARAGQVRGMSEPDYATLERCGRGLVPDWISLPLMAELVLEKVGSYPTRSDALRVLGAHQDARVRAAGVSTLAALWPEGSATDRQSLLDRLVLAFQAESVAEVGAALEVTEAVYEAIGADDRAAQDLLDGAVLQRAAAERDPEIAAGLLGVITERKLSAGAAICRAALTGPAVLWQAAKACLTALGESAPSASMSAALPAPPLDVSNVIGHRMHWRVTTTRGEVLIELQPDLAPWTVAAIAMLTQRGFYDGLAFHRVVPDFVVQGGDPTESGYGGAGFALPTEPSLAADGGGFKRGAVGLADAGKDSGGSQWFGMHSRAAYLDDRYTRFGRVVRGQEVLEALLVGDQIVRARLE